MSTQSILATTVDRAHDPERGHRLRLRVAYVMAATLILSLAISGYGYYTLDLTQRPFSPQHAVLKPSGSIGLKLGLLGFGCFFVVFLYPLRKRWNWLKKQGSSRHWLDFHVLLGLSAPFIIALHASFKFKGFAGMAFWIMLAVSISGVVGRYLYGQIPRQVNSTELSLKESRELQERLIEKLSSQRIISRTSLATMFHLPSDSQVERMPLVVCLLYMVALDIARPFHIARLRLRSLSASQALITLGGLLRSGNGELEQVIAVAREQAALSKRLLFLSRAQRVFHLWHVVHKPFSYSFVVLALIHITVVFLLGFM